MSSLYGTVVSPSTYKRIEISINQSILTVHTIPELGELGGRTNGSDPRPGMDICLAMEPSPLELLAASIVYSKIKANSMEASRIIFGEPVAPPRAADSEDRDFGPTAGNQFINASAASGRDARYSGQRTPLVVNQNVPVSGPAVELGLKPTRWHDQFPLHCSAWYYPRSQATNRPASVATISVGIPSQADHPNTTASRTTVSCNVPPSMNALAKPFLPRCTPPIPSSASRDRSLEPHDAKAEDHMDFLEFVLANRGDMNHNVKVDTGSWKEFGVREVVGIHVVETNTDHPRWMAEGHSPLAGSAELVATDDPCWANPGSSQLANDPKQPESTPTLNQSSSVEISTGRPTEVPHLATPWASPASTPAAPGTPHDHQIFAYVTAVEYPPYDQFLPPHASRTRILASFFRWYIHTRYIHAQAHLNVLQYIYNILVGWDVDILGLASAGLWPWQVIGVHPELGSDLARSAHDYLGWVTESRCAAQEFAEWWVRTDTLERFDACGRGSHGA